MCPPPGSYLHFLSFPHTSLGGWSSDLAVLSVPYFLKLGASDPQWRCKCGALLTAHLQQLLSAATCIDRGFKCMQDKMMLWLSLAARSHF